MKTFEIKENIDFVGRKSELGELERILNSDEDSIIIMYGRRRVGKTELLEQFFKNRSLLKFESWTDFFITLNEHIRDKTYTAYLEELQWIAHYDSELISELKYAWDNFLRFNNKLILILCGSAPSFMIEKVIHSKALYNRSQYEFHLREFDLIEAKSLLKNRSNQEVLTAYLTVGGMPLYLKWLNTESSVFLSLCNSSFMPNGLLSKEYEKIFTSSLSNNSHYKEIIEILSSRKFLTREEIIKILKLKTGGGISKILIDLEKSGFIQRYTPYNLNEKSNLARYTIIDNYLQFYFKFIHPVKDKIANGDFKTYPTSALNRSTYDKWLGFAFERFCRRYSRVIANILGFGAVAYTSGVFFNRATNKEDKGCQLDLIFNRADGVYTVCEIKYSTNKISNKVIEEFSKKIELFANKENKTIHRVLIASNGVEDSLLDKNYFDNIITMDNLFNPLYW